VLKFALAAPLLALAACSSVSAPVPIAQPAPPIRVQMLAINDFHGNLEPSNSPIAVAAGTEKVSAVMGGAAELAAALDRARDGHPNTITVAAGDLVGASPLTSAWFLDEPTVDAMNLLGLSVASIGNHEFDKGTSELLRLKNGGCATYTPRVPCRLEPFAGAKFDYLAANVVTKSGATLFPSTVIRQVGSIRIGFIGETLRDTGSLVTPGGVAGVRFTDEAETANALVPALKAAGADAIVLLIHQGGKVPDTYVEKGCDGLTGAILPILDKLDPAITTVVSGHTHNAYACTINAGGAPRLLTSGGKFGYLYTDIELTFDGGTHKLLAQGAANVPVTGSAGADRRVAELVRRYKTAAAPVADRVIGTLGSPAPYSDSDGESPAADLIADATLNATRPSGAQLALVNASGVRIGIPAGPVTYGNAFAMMPFGNNLLVMTMTGAQLKAALEQQYSVVAAKTAVLAPSAGFTYSVDVSKPEGSRVSDMRLNGRAIEPSANYRVAVNNYLASGGDNLSAFTAGTDVTDPDIIDVDAMVEWIAKTTQPPVANRVRIIG
jgi:5'-nucleotidase